MRSDASDSPQRSSNSKGSPNEEKQKQVYKNLLAQQCLGHEVFSLTPNYENMTNPLIRTSIETQNPDFLPQAVRGADPAILLETTTGMNCFYDQHSGIMTQGLINSFKTSSRGGLVSSPSSIPIHSSNSILQFHNETAFDFQMRSDFDAHPLKLRHGFGFDAQDQEAAGDANEHAMDSRKINKLPFKVLDAPQLQDDFYLNLVDWSSQNVLAVGLNRAVYIWSACTSQVKKLCEVPLGDAITSISWSGRGKHLAIGTNSGDT